MDAVTNLTTAASRVIWGDAGADTAHDETAGKEPVSGQMGNVAAGEPYDKGNAGTYLHTPMHLFGTRRKLMVTPRNPNLGIPTYVCNRWK
jgi:hypothetical protein